MNPTLSNRIIFILSLIGFGVAAYITLADLRVVDLPCGISNDCAVVAQDSAAKGLGIPGLQAIPTGAFGALMYLTMAALSMARVVSFSPRVVERAGVLIRLFSGLGVAVSTWLTYREAFVIHAWCKWCVGSAAVVLLIFITSMAERLAAPPVPIGEAA